jgi:hypothetical protein
MSPSGWGRLPYLAAALALTAFANFYIGETPLGWGVAILGAGLFLYGSAGFCPACSIMGCKVPARPFSGDERS